MNKNICLLVLTCLLALTFAQTLESSGIEVERKTRHYPVLNWWMSQNDWFLTTMTTWFCFNVGMYNIYIFNDGGMAFYQCLNSYVGGITYV